MADTGGCEKVNNEIGANHPDCVQMSFLRRLSVFAMGWVSCGVHSLAFGPWLSPVLWASPVSVTGASVWGCRAGGPV